MGTFRKCILMRHSRRLKVRLWGLSSDGRYNNYLKHTLLPKAVKGKIPLCYRPLEMVFVSKPKLRI